MDYEKLGAFYLGRLRDPGAAAARPDLLLYDSKDLTTHAVCVGMTGSGKTGLCIGLLEEAAIDGIPAIIIDPKGDLGNLLLTFPQLAASDFQPWIDEGEAARKGETVDAAAARVAAMWRDGLAEWGQDAARIARYRDAVDTVVYTPGSNAGIPLSVLRSFAAPGRALLDDADALHERVGSAVSGLLTLIGRDADPIASRDHILIANILAAAWREGRDLDIAGIIRAVQSPPMTTIGVLDIESFYPAKERMALAMALNNLLASPGFAAWMEGEPLDVARLLWTPEGRPRLAIISIAHLGDAERMFIVTLLLNEMIAWMRAQAGTSSLRALLYMDEVFGYFPPTANPPSKIPMLTLLKQARAYGLGVVLATQNPVDLDYKGLSNAGTWFIGRLQTERDKARVLEGLEGASTAAGAAFDKAAYDAMISGLGSRVFLMNNVHDDAPVLFQTRWTLSYLRGPLTKAQIAGLMAARKATAAANAQGATGMSAASPTTTSPSSTSLPATPSSASTPPSVSSSKSASPAPLSPGARPVLPADVAEAFHRAAAGAAPLAPSLFGVARVHFISAKADVDMWENVAVAAPIASSALGDPWESAAPIDGGEAALGAEPPASARFAEIPAGVLAAKALARWPKLLADHLYRTRTLTMWSAPELKSVSRAGESEGEFRARLAHRAHEDRDALKEKIRAKAAPQLARIEERLRTAVQRAEREKAQYEQQKMQSAISIGATVVGALFGRKIASTGNVGRATTAARGMGRAAREREDAARAEESVDDLRARLAEIEAQIEADLATAAGPVDPASIALEPLEIRPRKSDISVTRVGILWGAGSRA
ncbi:MAG: helicase HerA domain-containing protein [bacterium]